LLSINVIIQLLKYNEVKSFRSFKLDNNINSKNIIPSNDIIHNKFSETSNNTIIEETHNDTYIQRIKKLFDKENITSLLIILAMSINGIFQGLGLGLMKNKTDLLYLLIAISVNKLIEFLHFVTY
jgi:hypothetical protein